MDDERVTDAWPGDRDMSIVFQNLALYPDKTVYNNLAFPLKQRKTAKDETKRRVEQTAKLLHIEHLLKRKPAKLSGGERQRVALGRAIVRDPQAYLFDEPLSALDALLRLEMRTELKRLQRELGRTLVYVTHDQVEAMSMPDRILVLREGVIQQIDTPERHLPPPRQPLRRDGHRLPADELHPRHRRRANGTARGRHALLRTRARERGPDCEVGRGCGVPASASAPEDIHIAQRAGQGPPASVYVTGAARRRDGRRSPHRRSDDQGARLPPPADIDYAENQPVRAAARPRPASTLRRGTATPFLFFPRRARISLQVAARAKRGARPTRRSAWRKDAERDYVSTLERGLSPAGSPGRRPRVRRAVPPRPGRRPGSSGRARFPGSPSAPSPSPRRRPRQTPPLSRKRR